MSKVYTVYQPADFLYEFDLTMTYTIKNGVMLILSIEKGKQLLPQDH